ncbi:hypothetical protein [Mycobacterium avium]|uniref:hypothetical protein n=1 Tax=Mycobacterium avium TaxID=1764 RepID=UPI001E54F2CC|nr:hypothetical protein [Mycobacterium avium]UGU22370.1 hypothetical protein LT348_11450 [Mycobacterium avium subsp. avium]
MSGHLASQPSAGRWHAIGLIAFLWLVGIYSVKARLGGAGDPRLYGLLGGAALAAVAAALVGRLRGRQESRALLAGWPVASLLLTTVVGAVDPAVTRDFPGTITITFAYIGPPARAGVRWPSSRWAWRPSWWAAPRRCRTGRPACCWRRQCGSSSPRCRPG